MSFVTPLNRNRVLYVGGLAEEVTEDLLRAAFIPFGEITEVMIPMNFQNSKHKGFGFVEFELREDALDALDNMNNAELFGKVLSINMARATALDKNRPVWEEQADEYFGVGEESNGQESSESTSEAKDEEKPMDVETAS
jgi:peptidyl-prolyl isomerase E (cyclophilin E)